MNMVPISLAEWPYPHIRAGLCDAMECALRRLEAQNQISLERLEGVTVIKNLTEALRNFDAGYVGDHGAVMRDTVEGRMITTSRDGIVNGHVFIPVGVALQIAKSDAPFHQLCVYTFVHECAHVQDLSIRAARFSKSDILDPPLAPALAASLQVAWNEYAACRLAAFSYPDQIADFKIMLSNRVAELPASRNQVRTSFKPTHDGRQIALTIALNLALPVLQSYCYLLGHCRGLGISLADNIPEGYVALREDSGSAEAFRALEAELDSLWESRSAWSAFSVFDGLVTRICAVISAITGLVMQRAGGKSMGVALAV